MQKGSSAQGLESALLDFFDRAQAADGSVFRSLIGGAVGPFGVVLHQGFGLCGVDVQAVFNGFFLVIDPLDQGLARDVITVGHFGRVKAQVVRASAGHVHTPARHALNDGIKGHINFKHIVQVDLCSLHRIGLGQSSGESIEQKAIGTIVLFDSFFDQPDDDLIAHQCARVHDGFGLEPQGRACFNSGSEHVAR